MLLRLCVLVLALFGSTAALVVGAPRVVTRSAAPNMGIAAFRTGDKVQVITGSDKGAVGKVRRRRSRRRRPTRARCAPRPRSRKSLHRRRPAGHQH